MEDLTREQAETLRTSFLESFSPLIKGMASMSIKLCERPLEEARNTYGLSVYLLVGYGYDNRQDYFERHIRRQVPEDLQDNVLVEIISDRIPLASGQ